MEDCLFSKNVIRCQHASLEKFQIGCGFEKGSLQLKWDCKHVT